MMSGQRLLERAGRPAKKVAIVQSCYIPWKGYFDLIDMVDEFMLLDDVQYTRRDWRNRNRIKTANGLKWLSIPIDAKGNFHQKIKDARISDATWTRRHWDAIRQSYGSAPHFRDYADSLERLYLECHETYLSPINHRFLTGICGMLGITTRITWSMDYRVIEGKSERLLDLCEQAGATTYLSGPAAKGYVAVEEFAANGIAVEWMDYVGYPPYEQLHGDFVHEVSVIDLLLNTGSEARRYFKSVSREPGFA